MVKQRHRLGKHLKGLVKDSQKLSSQRRTHILKEIIDLYQDVEDKESVEARQTRQAFLIVLAADPQLPNQEEFFDFFSQHIEPEDFRETQWGTPIQYFRLTQFLYALRSTLPAEKVSHYINNLLLHALSSFEKKQQYQHMIDLLQLVSISPTAANEELLQLRNHAYVHEMYRVRRFRRLLYGYLILQAVFILFIFPLLFINAENGAITEAIEEAADVQLEDEGRQYLTYADGLYWSLITASSIGYGDVTPVTSVGRAIAATLGIMGVITVSILAGLILYQITPRNF